jgi:methionine-S-sulfoxide reductase
MEPPFDNLPGVIETTPGYTGGRTVNPTYEQVCSGGTGHAEAVQITFDPEKIGYRELLEVFWRNIDPTTRDRQFADTGSQYRTAIFYHDEEQRRLAEESKAEFEKSGKFAGPIVTEIVPAGPFYRAESYHCQYYKKNPLHYRMYRRGSGREAYLEKTWGTRKG